MEVQLVNVRTTLSNQVYLSISIYLPIMSNG